MSEYDDLIEGYDSSLPSETLGPLSDDENQKLEELIGAPSSEGERPADVGEGAGSIPVGPIPFRLPAQIVRDPYPLPEGFGKETMSAEGMKRFIEEQGEPGPPLTNDSLRLPMMEDEGEPPVEPGDWPDEPVSQGADLTATGILSDQHELTVLRGDQRPRAGTHYVIWDGLPRPVIRGGLELTEDEFVREHLNVDGLKDADGNRFARAERTLRMRYRGYLCGQLNSL